MALFFEISLWSMALALLVPSTVLFWECCAALLPQTADFQGERPLKIAVLVPAHNEAEGIAQTIQTLLPQLTEGDRLIVIADNCTDNTAAIARQAGATVIERQDLTQRGKGYALDYGVRFLELQPPDVVVVIDGDCLVADNTINSIARLAYAKQRPIQAPYVMEPPPHPSARDTISALAVIVKNVVRPYGLARLGLPCLLTGSGMAFPWQAIQNAPLATSKTADDMQLSVDLAIAGCAPGYCSQGQVTGRLMEREAAASQRRRWEHGHLENVLTQAPRLMSAALRQKRPELLSLGLEVAVPPLSLVILLWGTAISGAIAAGWLGISWMPLVLLGFAGFLIFIAILLAWGKFARQTIPASALIAIPCYLFWKLPLYAIFLIKPQSRWLKTERDCSG
jgi:cellulose synthase/poly-beta-1,6-N-acetylglucosamine synthase-like glycosyltransferase